jgi:dTDP-4-dehydrorhamnose 3,5-epimerase
MKRLDLRDCAISGLWIVSRTRLSDQRGFLSRLFCADELLSAGWSKPIAQINHTFTATRGTVRGLHFQRSPHAEMKLVSCIRGEVWDVAIDLRRGSPTFMDWHAERLSAENGVAVVIPEGFAHGFQTLSDDVELLYCHSAPFNASAEVGFHPTDPALAINWPLPVANLSTRDASHPLMEKNFEGLTS